MNRREFARHTAAIGSLGLAGAWGVAQAQGGPIEGTHYVTLSGRVPVSAPAGQVEVVEFFWYGCPHCYHFEPTLEAWAARLPADVSFRRVPVAFRPNPFSAHQRLYYAIETLGLLKTLHPQVFRAMHENKLRLDSPEAIADFVARQGVDKNRFLAAYNAFDMGAKLERANKLANAYKIDGVPALGVGGRFFTSVAMNGTPERALATTNALIERIRKGA